MGNFWCRTLLVSAMFVPVEPRFDWRGSWTTLCHWDLGMGLQVPIHLCKLRVPFSVISDWSLAVLNVSFCQNLMDWWNSGSEPIVCHLVLSGHSWSQSAGSINRLEDCLSCCSHSSKSTLFAHKILGLHPYAHLWRCLWGSSLHTLKHIFFLQLIVVIVVHVEYMFGPWDNYGYSSLCPLSSVTVGFFVSMSTCSQARWSFLGIHARGKHIAGILANHNEK